MKICLFTLHITSTISLFQSLVYKLKTNITFFNITAICKSCTKRKILKLNRKPFRNLTNANKKKGRINITRVKMNVL